MCGICDELFKATIAPVLRSSGCLQISSLFQPFLSKLGVITQIDLVLTPPETAAGKLTHSTFVCGTREFHLSQNQSPNKDKSVLSQRGLLSLAG